MKLIEKLYKATLDVKRAIELPLMVRQTEKLLDKKQAKYDEIKDDAELDLVRLRIAFVEASKDEQDSIFDRIVNKQREIEEAAEIARVAKAEKAALWADVE